MHDVLDFAYLIKPEISLAADDYLLLSRLLMQRGQTLILDRSTSMYIVNLNPASNNAPHRI